MRKISLLIIILSVAFCVSLEVLSTRSPEVSIEEESVVLEIEDTELENIIINNVEVDSDFKSYMDYRKVTDDTSPQYELLKSASPNEKGLMMINGAYCIATGSAYGEVGDYLNITLEDGSQFLAIKSDEKKDIHTINGSVDKDNSSVIEFVVDIDRLDPTVKKLGTVSALEEFSSKVVAIYEE